MSRCIVSVATDSYVRGQERLVSELMKQGQCHMGWTNTLPAGSPPHRPRGICGAPEHLCVPYAFKAYALKAAAAEGYTTLLWCDACIVPVRSLVPLWERIERDGYWFAPCGWNNAQWTCDEAYRWLFPDSPLEPARSINSTIPHVVATAFGLDISSEIGCTFLSEYLRLASETRAFIGPWHNTNSGLPPKGRNQERRWGPCGPPSTLGHRHDQAAASVIAWRLGMQLDGSGTFAYAGGGNENTILEAREIPHD